MIDCKRSKEILKHIPSDLIYDLWKIGADHDYASVRQEREWTEEDEFWRQVGYEMRIRG